MEQETKLLIKYGAHGLLTAGELFGFSEMVVRHLSDSVLDGAELGLLVIVLLVTTCTQILLPERGPVSKANYKD